MIGEIAGSYRIVSRLSEGGMGVVYRGEHTMIGRPVAVKVLLPELSHQRDIVTRFFNEARAASAVRHPGIVEIFDFGFTAAGMAYLVMELLEGESLARRLRRVGRMAEGEACALVRATTSALAAAHAHGIVHRDLKPDNLFLCPDPEVPGGERPKLLDFGIAKLGGPSTPQSASLTRTGAVLGTPTYMAPEQCRGAGEVDHRADLYALGCILYELVTGRPPFTSQAPGELIAAHLMATPDAPRALVPTLSPACEQIILRLLAKRPDERFAGALEVGAALAPLSTALSGAAWSVPAAFDATPTQLATPAPAWGASPPTLPDPPEQAATQVPTTLGSSAGEATPRRSRGKVIGVAAAVAAVVFGVTAVLVGGSGGKRVAPEPRPGTGTPATKPPATTTPVTTPPATTTTTPQTTTEPSTPPTTTPVTTPTTTTTEPSTPPTTPPVTTTSEPSTAATTTTATTTTTTKPEKPARPDKPRRPQTPRRPPPRSDTGPIETDI